MCLHRRAGVGARDPSSAHPARVRHGRKQERGVGERLTRLSVRSVRGEDRSLRAGLMEKNRWVLVQETASYSLEGLQSSQLPLMDWVPSICSLTSFARSRIVVIA